MRSGSNNQLDGMVYLYRGKHGRRSIDVEISLQAPTMEKLEQDKVLVWVLFKEENIGNIGSSKTRKYRDNIDIDKNYMETTEICHISI
ncbi:hypothetical protein DVH24_040945 [Malus domestica]|uniref:Uncharacterized protein n=1 Tax=Malus domestica TaxID=3750 RepID=A0A498I7S4_MALDO|nr:hypothetical protein DVH24_040945 [Malus domestica]